MSAVAHDLDRMILDDATARRRQLLLRRRTQLMARQDLITFIQFMQPDPNDPDDVTRSLYFPMEFHRIIADHLMKVENGSIKRLIINMPPRHGKTTEASHHFIPWFEGRNPLRSMIFGTYNEKFSWDIGRECRNIMEHPNYKTVFPDVKLRRDSKAKDRIQTVQGGLCVFAGRGGTVTGRGGDCVVIDDPIKDRKEADSPTIRNALWTWFTQVIMTRFMTDDAALILIQTRWHYDDLVGRLTDPTNHHYDPEAAKDWVVLDIPALAVEDDILGRKPGQALWPQRFSQKYLEAQRRTDPRGFSALYQGRPSPDDGTFFLASHIETYKPAEIKDKQLRYYVASDHAVSTAQHADKTCILPVGVDSDGMIYVMPEVILEKLDTDHAVERMIGVIRKYRPLFWWAERGHISRSIGPFLRKRMIEEQTFCTMLEITPDKDKQQRAQSIQARMTMGMVKFPAYMPWFEEAKDQLLKFPNAAHDDFVDALAYIGLGLDVQSAASKLRPRKDASPKQGTAAWVVAASNRERKQASLDRDAGGF